MMVEIAKNEIFISLIQHASCLKKGNDKVDEIIVTFNKDLGHTGALAFESSLKKYF